jgi:hypothetical protein
MYRDLLSVIMRQKLIRLFLFRELRLLSTPAPRNALEEMILWTEQGKLWHFPVDNEQVGLPCRTKSG